MHASSPKPATRVLLLLACLGIAAVLNSLGWWWPNRPVAIGNPGEPAITRIDSVSFAPFRRGQSPLSKVYPTAEQVEEDLASLQGIARGVRTYTAREGLEIVPARAPQYGLAVMQGVWLGAETAINEAEVKAAIELAGRHPDAIKSLVVGNEVLLRKDLTVDQLIAHIRRVKAAVKQPVTYADVWEVWLRFPQLLDEVDFVTVHFLPYWEDHPVGVDGAMPHIMDVYRQVVAALPGKPIVIGEVGWPSQGRSRQEAVASRVEAARFIEDFLQLAAREKLAYNLVEAYDQPWKVALEGTVGGAWGVLDEFRNPKFDIGGAVSELPQWPLIAGMGLLIMLILVIPRAPRLAALPPARMLAAVLFAQMLGGFLAATIDHGIEHNYSTLRFAEFLVMTGLQALFGLLLFGELLDRFSGQPVPVVALRALGESFADMRRFAFLPFGAGLPAKDRTADIPGLRRVRLGETLFGLFALLAVYQCLMLVVAGRYRDFPLDYFLLPVCGLVIMRILVAAIGEGPRSVLPAVALGAGFIRLSDDALQHGRFHWEAALSFLLLALPVMVVLVEKPDNREAVFWCLTAAAYALPLLGNLFLAARADFAHKAIAESAPSR